MKKKPEYANGDFWHGFLSGWALLSLAGFWGLTGMMFLFDYHVSVEPNDHTPPHSTLTITTTRADTLCWTKDGNIIVYFASRNIRDHQEQPMPDECK